MHWSRKRERVRKETKNKNKTYTLKSRLWAHGPDKICPLKTNVATLAT